jgi:uncharacterized protein
VASLAFVLALACTSVGSPDPCVASPARATFGDGRASLQVDLAESDAARARGLMGVTDLPRDHGMAFLWGAPTDGTFWMKDTLIPLSIAFADDTGRIITIHEMTPCTGDPCDTYAASGPYLMALEANAGWFDRNDVQVGDRVHLTTHACA